MQSIIRLKLKVHLQSQTLDSQIYAAIGGLGRQADWDTSDSTSLSFIKHKPIIPTDISQLSDSQGLLNKPINQVQADWNLADITSVSYIKNKPIFNIEWELD